MLSCGEVTNLFLIVYIGNTLGFTSLRLYAWWTNEIAPPNRAEYNFIFIPWPQLSCQWAPKVEYFVEFASQILFKIFYSWIIIFENFLKILCAEFDFLHWSGWKDFLDSLFYVKRPWPRKQKLYTGPSWSN